MLWTIIGASAAILTMFSFVPQIIKISRTKSAKDISIATVLQLAFGVSLWIAYGIYLEDAIIITANAVTLTSMVIIMLLYCRYSRIPQR
ncbi:MAG: SemiSWEET transporter [Candidatus Omnitrophota bacterium]